MSKLIVGDVETNSINGGPIAGFRNAIINGNFDHWQRGTSGTSGYISDRWRTLTGGSTAAISRQAFTLGQTDVPNEPEYFHRVVATSVAGAGSLVVMQQRVEFARTFAGQTVTLSFWAKADAAKNMAVEFAQDFGVGGSAFVSAIGVTTIALTTAWQKFTVTVANPSIAGKTIGSQSSFDLTFWLDAGSDHNARSNSLGQQSGTFDIAQVQLEAGSVATPFERRPVGTELALCQRFYQKTDTTASAGKRMLNSSGGSFAVNVSYDFPVTMRVTPSLTVYGDIGDGAQIVVGAAGGTITKDGFSQYTTVSNNQFLDYHYHIADAEL
jgi:hypothetical protein